jgi:outer membrane lipoprotein-sorting protein
MRPAENIKRLIKNLQDTTSAEMDQQVLRDVLLALEESEKTSALTSPNIRRQIMKSPIIKIAAAAVIIIVIIAGVYHTIGPIDITAPVFGDVMEQIYKARSVTYKQTFFPGESWESTTTEMIIKSGIMRSEQSNGDILISDFDTGKTLHLMPNSKRAILTQRASRPREKKLFNYLDWISRIHGEGGKFTGQQETNGKMTNVFIKEVPSDKITVWVDPNTNLPVRVETILRPNPIMVSEIYLTLGDFGGKDDAARSIIISSSSGSPKGIKNEMTTVMSDFVWNAELDESLFSLEPSEEYTVEERQFDTVKTRRNSLVQALTFWAEMSDGMFPSKIDDLGDPNMIRPLLIKKFDKDGDPTEELDQAMKQLDIILKGLSFAQFTQQKVGRSWHYTGDGVKLGDAEKVIFWYRSKDSETYRVIYGDLSVKKVTPENLPK